MIEEAQDNQSHVERFIDRFARVYTPLVIVLSLVVYLWTQDIKSGITLLVLACPGALVIGVPVVNVSAIGVAANRGILFKGSESLRLLNKVVYFVFDKTGTLTKGKPSVIDSWANDDIWYGVAYNMERFSNHPISKAIMNHVQIYDKEVEIDVKEVRGQGLSGVYNGQKILLGNERLTGIKNESDHMAVFMVVDGVHKASFYLTDEIRIMRSQL